MKILAIPKKIHYVWVGKQPKSKDIKKCMKTWSKYLGDYEIIEWNENNFDIQSNKFVKQAYENKKWAYVSDYIRAYAIYNYGGIYLDTDVLVLESLDKFLKNKAFVGFENDIYPFTAVFGAEKGHPFVKDMLDYYNDKNFEFDVNNQLANVNTKTVSDILIKKYNCVPNNKFQILDNAITVYPDSILCNPSKSSSTIHVFTGTWMEGAKPISKSIVKFFKLRITSQKRAMMYKFFLLGSEKLEIH